MNSEIPQIPESNSSLTNNSNNTFEAAADTDINTVSTSEAVDTASEIPSDLWLDEPETIANNPSASTLPESNSNSEELELPLDTRLDEAETPTPAVVEDNPQPETTSVATEPELFADSWLDESATEEISTATNNQLDELKAEIEQLQQQKQALTAEINDLQQQKQLQTQQLQNARDSMGRMVEEGMRELKERKNALQIDLEKLERRRERIRQEMRTSFAGVSQDLAIRVQGFKDYLVGSLQDLAAAAEQLELSSPPPKTPPKAREIRQEQPPTRADREQSQSSSPQFGEQGFVEQRRRIKSLLDQYRTRPDYYGAPWQLRRTFEPIHAQRVQDWFFTQGGRGAIKTMGSRLQNILIASAVISVLHDLYGDRIRTLILSDTPERLGEWRRGLQDCLGISRTDFSPNRGVGLFEAPEALVQKADRLVENKLIPLVIIDETEDRVSLSLLQFPLWLAFASEPQPNQNYPY